MKVVSQRQSNAAFQRYEFRVQRTDISGATNAVPPGAPLAARRAFETGQERSARRRRAVNGRVLALHAVPRVGAGLICATSATGAGGGTGRSDVWEASSRGTFDQPGTLRRRWHVRTPWTSRCQKLRPDGMSIGVGTRPA